MCDQTLRAEEEGTNIIRKKQNKTKKPTILIKS